VLGLGLATWVPQVETAPQEVLALAAARVEARLAKQWADADRLRGELALAGWEMEDQAGGYRLKRVTKR
jgi:cysteinyl-tRNA synthetase